MSQWISVTERMPDVCSDYLVTNGVTQTVASLNLSGEWDFYDESAMWDCVYITHWMPLPEPPKP